MTIATSLFERPVVDRIAVTGANGWLGREIVNGLVRANPEASVLALGSRPSVLRLAGLEAIQVHPWRETDVEEWAPTILVHLAYLTQERLTSMSVDDYVRANRELSAAALAAYSWRSIRGVIVASSGAAVQRAEETYGALKAEDEIAFGRAGERWGTPTVVARAWSLSGALCTKPGHFMFYDLIRQALGQDTAIQIRAARRVVRRYVDAAQYLAICVRALQTEWSGVIDSTGELTEAYDLAQTVCTSLGITKPVHRPVIREGPDEYFSDSPQLTDFARQFGSELSSLESQVVTSAAVFSSVPTEHPES